MESLDQSPGVANGPPELPLNGHPALVRLQKCLQTQDPIHLSMAKAAAAACLEPHYFSVIFHRYTGVSFIRWRRALRVARALRLMADGTLSIEQIVHAVGYEDRRSLERAVKTLLHSTPKSLRAVEAMIINSLASAEMTRSAHSQTKKTPDRA